MHQGVRFDSCAAVQPPVMMMMMMMMGAWTAPGAKQTATKPAKSQLTCMTNQAVTPLQPATMGLESFLEGRDMALPPREGQSGINSNSDCKFMTIMWYFSIF